MKRIISYAAVMLAIAVMACPASAQQAREGKGHQKPAESKEMQARDHKDVIERVRAEKVAFLTAEMDLTAEEAQAFWPVYNDVQKRQMEYMTKVREAYRAMDKAVREGASDAEVTKLIKAYDAAVEASHKAGAGSTEAYLKVLPATKVARLLAGEEKFRKTQWGRQGGPGQRPQGMDRGRGGSGPQGQAAAKGGRKPSENKKSGE